MTISTLELALPRAVTATVDDVALTVVLSDGRTISAPLAWFPRLLNATPSERLALDEDISVESLVAGRPSSESAQSLKRWLAARAARI